MVKPATAMLLAAAMAAGGLVAGCAPPKQAASQQSPLSQQISIDTSDVTGAHCTLTSVTVGRQSVTTPASIEVDRSPEIIVVLCRKACYLDTSALISPEGLRKPDGQVVYSYPATTSLTMRQAKSCDAHAPGPRQAAP